MFPSPSSLISADCPALQAEEPRRSSTAHLKREQNRAAAADQHRGQSAECSAPWTEARCTAPCRSPDELQPCLPLPGAEETGY
ncbi:hypothetical protein KUCAC02_013169 [Chaenocephalus aceratus]|uniref:Uncharacterized protein n=1 Tax=Chaenocephalus aceratus TaxID=36190 RepID=A0ACB9XEY5_CHAAC|nr:hypothetical protein KUCAC02_013169 [Chaenocephalus aceratus]